MKLSSSSTSNSEAFALRRVSVPVAVYTAAWLLLVDLALNLAFPPPSDPHVEPTGLQRYFDYGRSVESKLRAMVGPTLAESAPIAQAGWLEPATTDDLPSHASAPGHTLIAAYGQSFTRRLLAALQAVDARYEQRFRGGPGSPLSHSYEQYRLERGSHDADVVVIGVLASAIPELASLTNMTVQFEAPAPCTYPRFVLRDGKLTAIQPSVRSLQQLRDALADPVRWRRFVAELERYDEGYEAFVFERDPLDLSSLGRSARRAFGQRHARKYKARFVGERGFTNYAGVIDVAEALLAEFAASVRADGKQPMVLLFNDRGYSDYLYRALGPRLARRGVPYFSTHELAPATRAELFVPDGHFVPAIDRALATALRERLGTVLARR
jgi:hypothetical protein